MSKPATGRRGMHARSTGRDQGDAGMTLIQIDTSQVEAGALEFQRRAEEVQMLLTQSRRMMSELQTQFRGIRAGRVFSEWEAMQPGLGAAIQTLESAGLLLRRASTDFGGVDQAPI
jgi:WXG100 family type VII secretion target